MSAERIGRDFSQDIGAKGFKKRYGGINPSQAQETVCDPTGPEEPVECMVGWV